MSGKRLPLWVLFFGFILLTALSGPGDYRFPLNFNDPAISGTFGELRTNHFHSGLDIKTGGTTGHKIYAIEDGWIYRLKVSPWGFGKAIYLRHADGKFSVYAHLSGFPQYIEDFIYQKQYATKKYEQEIYLSRDRFPVKKGDLIAYSGNSGSSGGPHLHFEIRDPDERILNPQKEFPRLIRDDVVPVVQHIAIEPLNASSLVEGKFEKLVIEPNGGNGNYSVAEIIDIQGPVGVEYHAYDLLNAAGNHCGINYAKLFLDNQLIYEFALDRFAFDEKKYINVHFDYHYWKNRRQKFQKAYVEPGNEFSAYKNMRNRGVIELEDNKVHTVLLELKDTFGNTTTIRLKMRRKKFGGPENARLSGSATKTIINHGISRKTLWVQLKRPAQNHLNGLELRFPDGGKETLKPTILDDGELWYLYDLSPFRVPSEIFDPTTASRIPLRLKKGIFPYKNNLIDLGQGQVYFPYKCVFDTLFPTFSTSSGGSQAFSEVYKVGNPDIPIFKSFVISIKPTRKGNSDYMVIASRKPGGRWRYLGSDRREDGSIFASSGYFGEFCVMADSIPPSLTPKNFSDGKKISASQNTLSIRLGDNFSGVNETRNMLLLDDEWVLGEYDGKTATVTHRFKERPAAGKHILQMWVYDMAGNLKTESWTLSF